MEAEDEEPVISAEMARSRVSCLGGRGEARRFDSIQFNSIQLNSIQFNSTQPNPIARDATQRPIDRSIDRPTDRLALNHRQPPSLTWLSGLRKQRAKLSGVDMSTGYTAVTGLSTRIRLTSTRIGSSDLAAVTTRCT